MYFVKRTLAQGRSKVTLLAQGIDVDGRPYTNMYNENGMLIGFSTRPPSDVLMSLFDNKDPIRACTDVEAIHFVRFGEVNF